MEEEGVGGGAERGRVERRKRRRRRRREVALGLDGSKRTVTGQREGEGMQKKGEKN